MDTLENVITKTLQLDVEYKEQRNRIDLIDYKLEEFKKLVIKETNKTEETLKSFHEEFKDHAVKLAIDRTKTDSTINTQNWILRIIGAVFCALLSGILFLSLKS